MAKIQVYITAVVYLHTSINTTAVTPLLLLYCCITTKCHRGWADRFVGVTAALRTAVLL